jgi:hypothetical protein
VGQALTRVAARRYRASGKASLSSNRRDTIADVREVLMNMIDDGVVE